jgi:hypothetical protein
MTGIDYPTITVGAHENLVVRLSLASQLLMRRRGMDPAKMGALMQPTIVDPSDPQKTLLNPDGVQSVITVFSCMVAENFIDRSQPHKCDLTAAPTADYWATQIDDFPAVERAVWAAVGKAVEERRKRLAVVPPTEQAS